MYLGEFFFVFVLASILSFLLVTGLGWRHPRANSVIGSLAFTFVLIALFAWAASAWLVPAGPTLWGVSWIPLAGVGVLVALAILALAVPPAEPPVGERVEADTGERGRHSERALFAYGAVFWILVVAALSTAILGEAVL